jgi:hypothetical protein
VLLPVAVTVRVFPNWKLFPDALVVRVSVGFTMVKVKVADEVAVVLVPLTVITRELNSAVGEPEISPVLALKTKPTLVRVDESETDRE